MDITEENILILISNLQLKCLWIIFLTISKVLCSCLFHLNFFFELGGKKHGRKIRINAV